MRINLNMERFDWLYLSTVARRCDNKTCVNPYKNQFFKSVETKKKLVGGATTRAVFWRKAGEFGDSEPKMQVFVIDDCVLKLCKSI